MKRLPNDSVELLTLALACTLIGICGCAGDNDPVIPQETVMPGLIAQMEFSGGGGAVTSPIEFIRFRVGYPEEQGDPNLGVIGIRDGDEGRTVEFSSDTSTTFDAFMALICDGSDELVQGVFWWSATPGGSIGVERPESESFLDGAGPGSAPDLAGEPVDRVEATITRSVVNCPGSDPNGDGNWVDYQVTVVISFYGPDE